MKIKKFIARIYDLPNAFRVLDIMDDAGVSITKVDRRGFENADCWQVTIPYYISEQQAKDLRTICQFKNQYKQRSVAWHWIYRSFHSYSRILQSWFG